MAVFAIAPLQCGLAFSVEDYYALAIIWNTFLIWRTVTSADAANPKSFSPSNAA